MQGHPKFDPLQEVKIVPELEKLTDMIKILWLFKVVSLHQHANFQVIPSRCSSENAQKT